MIKLTFCLHRLPELTREQFQTYWYEKHAPLVKSHAQTLGIRRYVQIHALTHAMNDALRTSRDAPEMYDGIAELWWDDLESLLAANASEEGRTAGLALLEDERKFIDLSRSPLWFNEEKVIVG